MAGYHYCLVENTYVVRQRRGRDGAEYLTPEGDWLDYLDLWDVTMNGRPLADEAAALATAQWVFARDPAWWASHRERRAAQRARRPSR